MSKKLDEIKAAETAVTTRAQKAKEDQEDDLLSAQSGAQPKALEEFTGLVPLDDSL